MFTCFDAHLTNWPFFIVFISLYFICIRLDTRSNFLMSHCKKIFGLLSKYITTVLNMAITKDDQKKQRPERMQRIWLLEAGIIDNIIDGASTLANPSIRLLIDQLVLPSIVVHLHWVQFLALHLR